MELISSYLYNRIPIRTTNIENRTFHFLKRHGWYSDSRSNRKFTMLNKRFKINGQWYRALIRFQNDGTETFELSIPCPFVITKSETEDEISFKDTKTFHGPKLKNVIGFFEAGVPSELIDQIYQDLREHVTYKDGTRASEELIS